ncbi:Cof-type HAD-IIB family hydrolase [Paenibacillus gansuensis]|uniref:Cof-type HAD-IIB family hydrolase n=1 Tax=Paenibacillus gansuensis TaxID=306542 RepID=A0ABW5PEF4_9BACL
MPDYKLIALDMDGTLLNESLEVSEENRKWIRAAQEAGITVCLSTGRGYASALPYAEQLELNGPMVLVNGSEVWENPQRVLKREHMDLSAVRHMREIAVRHNVWYWAYSVTGVYNREQWPDSEEAEEWLKFGYYEQNAEILAAVAAELEPYRHYELTNSSPDNIEINPPGVSKESGLREVCKLMGIEMSQVVAMGDSLNDIAAIRAAGLGIAMGNAQDAVKNEADQVTLTNNDHGVGHAIKEYVLKV